MDDTFLERIFDAGTTVGAEEVLFFPTFNDQALFKKFLSEDNPNLAPAEKEKKPKGAGTLISMLKYNFEIHGNSGIVMVIISILLEYQVYIQKQVSSK